MFLLTKNIFDIKLSKAQISKIFQFGGSFGSCLGNLGKKHQQVLLFVSLETFDLY